MFRRSAIWKFQWFLPDRKRYSSWMHRLLVLPIVFALVCVAQKSHVLKATPETVVIGHYDATSKPVLRIQPNDTVRIEALGVGSPEQWTGAGLSGQSSFLQTGRIP